MQFDEKGIQFPEVVDESPSIRAALIRELLDNSRATRVQDSLSAMIRMESADACKLKQQERQILGLPGPYPFTLKLESKGVFGSSDLSVAPRFYAFPEGALLPGKRTGAVLELRGTVYLLSENQFGAVSRADEVRGDRGTQAAMVSVARLKAATKDTSVTLDRWLDREEIVVPDKFKLQVERRADGVYLSPDAPEAPGFSEKFSASPRVQSSYSIDKPDGGRTRVVITPRQQQQLAKIKRLAPRGLSEEDTLKILENADEWLGDDVFDLEDFSQRVLEIGVYRPRYYPFIAPYKTDWFPGFIAESPDGEKTQVSIRTEDELTELDTAINEAAEQDSRNVSYCGHSIPISDARQIADNARAQLRDQTKPNPAKSAEKKVLIIKENVEASEFTTATKVDAASHDFVYEAPSSMRHPYEPKNHQTEAIAWLQTLCKTTSGVLLADDMGLGKTLTVLAFLRWADTRKPFSQRPHLVVAPLSLLDNWEREYKKFFLPGRPHAERLHGSSAKAQLRDAQDGVFYVTTYETVRRHQLLFGRIDWGVVALDEVQRIKTPGTLITNAAKALKAEFRIGMTGTPVENTLVDLWCIVDFLVPGFLGSAREFVNKYERAGRTQDESLQEVGESLRERLGVLLKRRLKGDVLGELPDKHEHHIKQHMTETQAAAYRSILRHVNDLRTDGSNKPGEILSALTKLRLVSDHPALVGNETQVGDDRKIMYESGKMISLVKVLKSIKGQGEKAIVFAELKRSQRMIALMIDREFGFLPRIVNGDMPANAGSARLSRQEAIDEFESAPGFSTIVMSPIAAGVGLNVTAANHVIHYSRHWNPAKEQQATDRAYRIGQEKDVHVYYLMGTLPGIKTFDELLADLLARKKALAEATLFPSERIEVKSDEILQSISELDVPNSDEVPLQPDQVRRMHEDGQRAAIALLLERSGYDIEMLPPETSHGADLLAMGVGRVFVVGRQADQARIDPSYLDEAVGYVSGLRPRSDVSKLVIQMWKDATESFSLDQLMHTHDIMASELQRFHSVEDELVA